eukprot:scaffold36275_cov154-Isochrysis_galbana.AAC.14
MLVAVRPAEQAVSISVHGPWRPRANERRPEAMDCELPVAEYTEVLTEVPCNTVAKSWHEKPR